MSRRLLDERFKMIIELTEYKSSLDLSNYAESLYLPFVERIYVDMHMIFPGETPTVFSGKLKNLLCPQLLQIHRNSFSGCTNLETLVIPQVTIIPDGEFEKFADSIQVIVLPEIFRTSDEISRIFKNKLTLDEINKRNDEFLIKNRRPFKTIIGEWANNREALRTTRMQTIRDGNPLNFVLRNLPKPALVEVLQQSYGDISEIFKLKDSNLEQYNSLLTLSLLNRHMIAKNSFGTNISFITPTGDEEPVLEAVMIRNREDLEKHKIEKAIGDYIGGTSDAARRARLPVLEAEYDSTLRDLGIGEAAGGAGGPGAASKYYIKYLKYKNKYLMLKHKL